MAKLNAAVSLFNAIPMALILLGNLHSKYRTKSSRSLYFLLMLFFDVLMLSFNAISFQLEGLYDIEYRSSLWYLTCLIRGLSDIFYFAILALFVLYCTEYISEKHKISNVSRIICIPLCVFQGILWFISSFNGIIYRSDDFSVTPGPLYDFGQLGGLIVAVIALAVTLKYRKYLSRSELNAFLSFIILPLIGIIIRPFFPDIVLLPLLITYAILTMQCFTQINKALLMQEQKAELERAKVDVMMSQIQPHFIYNALNSIYSLCDISPEKSKEAIAAFAEYLRASLPPDNGADVISFEQELDHVKNYLRIEKLRFGDSLEIIYDIEATDFRLPRLSLQTVVENAVRHGITKKKEGGSVTIKTRRLDSGYLVTVEDTGAGFNVSETGLTAAEDGRKHIGLTNTKYRLEQLCNAKLDISSEEGRGTLVTINIPAKVA